MNGPLWDALSRALFHFLWEGALIAAVPSGESTLPPPADAAPLIAVSGLGKRFRRGGPIARVRAHPSRRCGPSGTRDRHPT